MHCIPNQPENSSVEQCIRCHEAPAVDLSGYCGHCHWAVRAEVEECMQDFSKWLKNQDKFKEWLIANDRL